MNFIVFPGQGSQKIGMGKKLSENFPEAKEVFNEVNDALNLNLSMPASLNPPPCPPPPAPSAELARQRPEDRRPRRADGARGGRGRGRAVLGGAATRGDERGEHLRERCDERREHLRCRRRRRPGSTRLLS